MITDAPTELTLAFGGEAANLKPDAITAAVLKGLMGGFLDEDLNYVNAPFIASERGISIIETRSREVTDYVNTLTLTVRTGAGEHEVSGAVLGNRAMRLTRIDGYRVEAVPEGYFLMLHNRDVPGVVGAVGTLLGRPGINIAGLELGRDRVGGTALSLFEVDGRCRAPCSKSSRRCQRLPRRRCSSSEFILRMSAFQPDRCARRCAKSELTRSGERHENSCRSRHAVGR